MLLISLCRLIVTDPDTSSECYNQDNMLISNSVKGSIKEEIREMLLNRNNSQSATKLRTNRHNSSLICEDYLSTDINKSFTSLGNEHNKDYQHKYLSKRSTILSLQQAEQNELRTCRYCAIIKVSNI
jgi:hypothetical protein